MRTKIQISLGNGHADTILPFILRPIRAQKYERERIKTEDGDFIDLDWAQKENSKNNKLVILSHGLEGSSKSQYMQGMAQHFRDNGYDALSWNYRGCSGEVNKSVGYYHSGASYDLNTVIEHILKNRSYQELYLIGFSLGGNLTLKYAGERSKNLNEKIKGICVFSTPCCLKASSVALKVGFSKIYTKSFLKTLKQKVYAKKRLLKEHGYDLSVIEQVKTLPDFDDNFTAPLHGFNDADDYYEKCSSKHFIKYINIPTLIVNAKNDPFLDGDCYPFQVVKENEFVALEVPRFGGHVGFLGLNYKNVLWSEERALEFIQLIS